MKTAEQLFTHTFAATMVRFQFIKMFRQVAKLGIPAATPLIHKKWTDVAKNVFEGNEYDSYFTDKPGLLQVLGEPDDLVQKLATHQLNQFEASIDSASLIFAHSIVDAAALDYCRVTVLAAPEAWGKYVEKTRLVLGDFKGRNYDEVLKERVHSCVEELERQSLLIKVDRLFEVCQPPKDFNPMGTYRFNRNRLADLDRLRHEVVHSPGTVKPLPEGDADLWFLEQTLAFLVTLVNMRFGLRMNPAEFTKW